ncbi:MAG: UbiA family prenyltransferase [Halorientalis sp.]
MNVRPYLQLTRLHTVPLETVPAILGATLALGHFLDVQVLLWGVFGVLYHAAGYGMNSVEDWRRGWDSDDPNKQHHPLNAGQMTLRSAAVFAYGLLALLVVYVVAIADGWVPVAVFLTGGPLAGTLYNTIGKETRGKYALIAYSHATVFATPYLSLSDGSIPALFAGCAYVFVWVSFQTISGEIKDITQDEANLLLSLGSRVGERDGRPFVEFSRLAKLYAYGLRLLTVVIAVVLGALVTARHGDVAAVPHLSEFGVGVTILAVLAVGASSLVLTARLIGDGPFDRGERIATMSKIEITSVLMMVLALVTVVGVGNAFLLVGGAVGWVVLFNKIEWDTLVAPEV